MPGTPYDSDTELRAESNLTDANDGNHTAVEVEGPVLAEFHAMWELPTGTSPTLDMNIEVSRDGGSTFTVAASTRQFTESDAPGDDEDKFHVSIPVYIPKDTQADAYSGSLNRTSVRLNTVVAGTTPVFPNFQSWLAPCDMGSTYARENN